MVYNSEEQTNSNACRPYICYASPHLLGQKHTAGTRGAFLLPRVHWLLRQEHTQYVGVSFDLFHLCPAHRIWRLLHYSYNVASVGSTLKQWKDKGKLGKPYCTGNSIFPTELHPSIRNLLILNIYQLCNKWNCYLQSLFFCSVSLISQWTSKQRETENKLEHHTCVYIKWSLVLTFIARLSKGNILVIHYS